MDRHARDRHAVGERIADGVGAREGRQQRWMGVDDAPRLGGEDGRAHDPHVAGQHHHVRPGGGERLCQHAVCATNHERGVDSLLHGPVEGRARPVREDQDDLAAELATFRGGP